MRTKVVSVIAIVLFFLGLMFLGFYHLPPRAEVFGFWEYLAVFVYIGYVTTGTIAGASAVIKWFMK